VELLEDNNFYYIDLFPKESTSFTKEVDGLKVDFAYVDNTFQIKKVAYPKEKYSIDDVLEKAKNIMRINKEQTCPTCKGLNRLRELSENKKSTLHQSTPQKVYPIEDSATKQQKTDNFEILPTLLKSFIDVPSQIILTSTGRKIAKGFLALLAFLGSSLTKSDTEKKLLDKMFFSFVEDLSLKDKNELKYIAKDLSRLSKGLKNNNATYIKSAFIKTPEMLERYLDAINKEKGDSKVKKSITKRKFI